MKEELIGPPSKYLFGNLREGTLDNGQRAWDFVSKQYVDAVVNNMEEYIQNKW